MSALVPANMDERQLRNALGGAMAWQQIVQKRGGGPEDCADAVRQTSAICSEFRARGLDPAGLATETRGERDARNELGSFSSQ